MAVVSKTMSKKIETAFLMDPTTQRSWTIFLKSRTDATEFASSLTTATRLGSEEGLVYKTKMPKGADVAKFFKCFECQQYSSKATSRRIEESPGQT